MKAFLIIIYTIITIPMLMALGILVYGLCRIYIPTTEKIMTIIGELPILVLLYVIGMHFFIKGYEPWKETLKNKTLKSWIKDFILYMLVGGLLYIIINGLGHM